MSSISYILSSSFTKCIFVLRLLSALSSTRYCILTAILSVCFHCQTISHTTLLICVLTVTVLHTNLSHEFHLDSTCESETTFFFDQTIDSIESSLRVGRLNPWESPSSLPLQLKEKIQISRLHPCRSPPTVPTSFFHDFQETCNAHAKSNGYW